MTLSQGSSKTMQKTQTFMLQFTTVAKIQLWNKNENDFMVWGYHSMRNSIKVLQYQEG